MATAGSKAQGRQCHESNFLRVDHAVQKLSTTGKNMCIAFGLGVDKSLDRKWDAHS
jgi:hypothetical protein